MNIKRNASFHHPTPEPVTASIVPTYLSATEKKPNGDVFFISGIPEPIYKNLLARLKKLADKVMGPHEKHYGLCRFIKREIRHTPLRNREYVYSRLINFDDWEYFSGNDTYPVPHPDYMPNETSRSECMQMAKAIFTYHMDGMYEGEYGRMRLHLAQYLVDKLETFVPITIDLTPSYIHPADMSHYIKRDGNSDGDGNVGGDGA